MSVGCGRILFQFQVDSPITDWITDRRRLTYIGRNLDERSRCTRVGWLVVEKISNKWRLIGIRTERLRNDFGRICGIAYSIAVTRCFWKSWIRVLVYQWSDSVLHYKQRWTFPCLQCDNWTLSVKKCSNIISSAAEIIASAANAHHIQTTFYVLIQNTSMQFMWLAKAVQVTRVKQQMWICCDRNDGNHKVSHKKWALLESRHFSVTTNSYLLFYASDLYGFSQSHKLEVFCINT